MTTKDFQNKMIPLWALRTSVDDSSGVDFDAELMHQMLLVCVEFLSDFDLNQGQKLKSLFICGALVGYYWDKTVELFCEAVIDVFANEKRIGA